MPPPPPPATRSGVLAAGLAGWLAGLTGRLGGLTGRLAGLATSRRSSAEPHLVPAQAVEEVGRGEGRLLRVELGG